MTGLKKEDDFLINKKNRKNAPKFRIYTSYGQVNETARYRNKRTTRKKLKHDIICEADITLTNRAIPKSFMSRITNSFKI